MAVKTNASKVPNTYDRSQSIMVTTTWDRLYVKLDPHIQLLSKERSWMSALSLVLTLILALCTSEFKPFMGMSADTIKALFVLALFIAIVYFIYTVINALKSRKETLTNIVNDVFENMTYTVIDEEQREEDTQDEEQKSEDQ